MRTGLTILAPLDELNARQVNNGVAPLRWVAVSMLIQWCQVSPVWAGETNRCSQWHRLTEAMSTGSDEPPSHFVLGES